MAANPQRKMLNTRWGRGISGTSLVVIIKKKKRNSLEQCKSNVTIVREPRIAFRWQHNTSLRLVCEKTLLNILFETKMRLDM